QFRPASKSPALRRWSRVSSRQALPASTTRGSSLTFAAVVGRDLGGGINQDVGGATGMSFTLVSIHGGGEHDQAVTINGMSVASMSYMDNSRSNLQDGNVEEFSMQLAAAPAEYPSGGVSINAVPKQGGNAFRGFFFGGATQKSWSTNNLDADLQ